MQRGTTDLSRTLLELLSKVLPAAECVQTLSRRQHHAIGARWLPGSIELALILYAMFVEHHIDVILKTRTGWAGAGDAEATAVIRQIRMKERIA